MPKSTWLISISGLKTSTSPTITSSTCVTKSTIERTMLTFADSCTPTMLSAPSTITTPMPKTMSHGALFERLPEDAEVVRHEVRADRRRDDVVEHLAPGGEERPELVEGVARERARAAGLREHRRRLDVGGGGEEEDHAA